MKLELEAQHLAPYLCHELRIMGKYGDIEILDSLSTTSVNIKGRDYTYGAWGDIRDIKPILKPITSWIDYVVLTNQEAKWITLGSVSMIENLPVWKFEILLRNHIDVFGLINAGLAIDTNTLK